MKIGYARVSTEDQTTAAQEKAMREAGADRVYSERVSGRKTDKTVLNGLLSGILRPGDTLMVTALDRLGRNAKDVMQLIEQLHKDGIYFKVLNMDLDTETGMGKFVLHIFAAIAELEWNFIKERQAAGIAQAKQSGKYKGRSAVVDKIASKVLKLAKEKVPVAQIARHFGVSAPTIYKILKTAQVQTPNEAVRTRLELEKYRGESMHFEDRSSLATLPKDPPQE